MDNKFKIVSLPQYGIPAINESLNRKDFYISYCWRTSDYGCVTTAIVFKTDTGTKFLLLCGNHKEELANLATLNDCIEYFKKNIDKAHEYSDEI